MAYKKVTYYIDQALNQQIKILAVNLDKSQSDIVNEALSDYYQKHYKPKFFTIPAFLFEYIDGNPQ
jgi:predicted transcriptional regulator